MDSSDLTRDQLRQVEATIRPMAGYLSRLVGRMEQESFPHDDELLRLATEARANALAAAHTLAFVAREER